MGNSLLTKIEIALMAGACALSLLRGGAAERWGAALIVGVYILADISIFVAFPHFPTIINFGLDFGLAVGLLVVAIRFSSLWLGGAMMLQSIALCSYGLTASGDGLQVRSYIVLNNVLSLLMLGCIVAGTVGSWRRRLRARRMHDGSAGIETALA